MKQEILSGSMIFHRDPYVFVFKHPITKVTSQIPPPAPKITAKKNNKIIQYLITFAKMIVF